MNSLTLEFTEEDIRALLWVGGRYCWSNAILQFICEPGEITLDESDILVIVEEMDKDAEGGHQLFPCLSPGTSLSKKMNEIYSFMDTEE